MATTAYQPTESSAPIEASHRPVVGGVPRMLLLWGVQLVSPDEDEPPVLETTVDCARKMIAAMPIGLIDPAPVITAFEGEIHLQWSDGAKRLIAMCFPNREPLLHFYERRPGQTSAHGTWPASPGKLAEMMEWLGR